METNHGEIITICVERTDPGTGNRYYAEMRTCLDELGAFPRERGRMLLRMVTDLKANLDDREKELRTTVLPLP